MIKQGLFEIAALWWEKALDNQASGFNIANMENGPKIPRPALWRKSRHQVSPNAPMPKRNLRLGLEADVLVWFQADERNGGLSCEEHINQALRQYIINLIGDESALRKYRL